MEYCCRVQIEDGRIAVEGTNSTSRGQTPSIDMCDVIVLDLKSGKEICRLAIDFGLPNSKMFFLQKEKIMIACEGKVHSAQFWL